MKFDKAFFISILALGVIMVSSCGGSHDEPSEEDIFLNKLANTWNLTGGQVTVDGLDVTKDFAGLTITFGTDKQYTTTLGVPPIWPAAGTFTIKKSGDNAYDLTRDDGLQISVLGLTETSVTFELQYTAPAARSNSVSGKFRFVMKK